MSGRNSTNPAIWLVPGPLQWTKSIKLIYFRERIGGDHQSFALFTLLLTIKWRKIYSPYDGKESHHRYIQFRCLQLGTVMARNSVCLSRTILSKNWVNFSQVYFSNSCCIWENFCGVHLMNLLAICYSIYNRKVWFWVIHNEWLTLFL